MTLIGIKPLASLFIAMMHPFFVSVIDINHNEKNHSSDKRRTKYNYENSDDDFDTLIKKNNLKYKNNKNISNNQNDRQYGESNYDDEANWKKSEIIRNNDENTQFRIN